MTDNTKTIIKETVAAGGLIVCGVIMLGRVIYYKGKVDCIHDIYKNGMAVIIKKDSV